MSTQIERDAIASVLRTGFSEIHDKSLIEHSTEELFLAGLKDIRLLDTSMRLTVEPDNLGLVLGEVQIAEVPRPGVDDLPGWIEATTQLFDTMRRTSFIAQHADRESLYQIMFDGALGLIDPYSRYSASRNARINRAARNGFIGIGIEFDMVPGGALVSAVTKDGPASAAGLQPGDLIAAADGKSLLGMTRDGAGRLIAGPPDSVLKLSVYHPGEPRAIFFSVRRTLIVPSTVEAEVLNGVAFIKVKSFNVRTSTEVSQAIAAANDPSGEPLAGVVLDLRGDPGGLLDQAVDLSDLFLDGGTIATLTGRHPGAKQFYAAKPGDIIDGKPLVILVDGKSASSAEIAAAALADNGRALIVGTNTLGKGSVQTLIRLPNDAEMALTWAEVVAPGGYRMHGLGLLPTICTSDYTGPLATIMQHVFRHETPWRAMPVAWRTEDRSAESLAKLRRMCPAQPRPEEYVDQALALQVASDKALYAQAASSNIASSR